MVWVVALYWSLVHSLWQGLVLHACGWCVIAGVRSAARRHVWLVTCQLALLPAFVASFVSELAALRGARSPWVPALASSAEPVWPQLLMAATVAAWVCGLALMLARLARGFHGLAALERAGAPLCDWERRVAQAAARLGFERRVAVLEVAGVDSPLALGWLRPLIVLPLGWAAQLPPRVVEAALLHELAHLRRHDYLINLVQHALESLFFFHPSVWWLSRQVRRERELCCDQMVAETHIGPLDYASALLTLEQHRQSQAQASRSQLSLAVARGDLTARVEHVLGLESAPRRPRRALAAALAAALLSGLVVLGACLEGSPPESASSELQASAPLAAPLRPRWLPEAVNRFGASIDAAAAAHGLDPALLGIVVLVESRGNPDAVSPRGALGLMQVMPATAALIARERGLPSPTRQQLLEPAYNLDAGAYYLAQQLAELVERPEAERVELAAIAYNAGPNRLREYLAGSRELWPETVYYSTLVSELWGEREAEVSEAYRAISVAH